MDSLEFKQIISFPTHRAGGTLDLVFVRDERLVQNIKVYDDSNDVLLSDHFMIELSLFYERKEQTRKVDCFRRQLSLLKI